MKQSLLETLLFVGKHCQSVREKEMFSEFLISEWCCDNSIYCIRLSIFCIKGLRLSTFIITWYLEIHTVEPIFE